MQQTQGEKMQESQTEIHSLSRQFQEEIGRQSANGIHVSLTREQYDSLPNREYFKSKFPFPEGKNEIEMSLSAAEFGVLKLSAHPEVRRKQFNIYSNKCQDNADKVLKMLKLRQELASSAK